MGQLTDNQKRALGAVIRWGLLIVFAPLIRHQAVDGPVLGMAVDDLTAQLVGWLGALVVLGWSQIRKLIDGWKLKVALLAPAGTTEPQLNEVLKQTSPGTIPTGPLPSAGLVAAIVADTPKSGN